MTSTDPITERLDEIDNDNVIAELNNSGSDDVPALIAALRGVLAYFDYLESPELPKAMPKGKRLAGVIARRARRRIASALGVTL